WEASGGGGVTIVGEQEHATSRGARRERITPGGIAPLRPPRPARGSADETLQEGRGDVDLASMRREQRVQPGRERLEILAGGVRKASEELEQHRRLRRAEVGADLGGRRLAGKRGLPDRLDKVDRRALRDSERDQLLEDQVGGEDLD